MSDTWFPMPHFAYFFLLNFGLVGLSISFFFLRGRGRLKAENYSLWLLFLLVAALVVVLQYPTLLHVKGWPARIGVFYGGMVTFLFFSGRAVAWGWTEGRGGERAGRTRLKGGLGFVLLGHLVGLPFLPLIVGVNWLLWDRLFPG